MKACTFLTKSTDPFLAVKNCSEQLLEAGFAKLSKREPFAGKLLPGERNFVIAKLGTYFDPVRNY
jgi:hypothetical protein